MTDESTADTGRDFIRDIVAADLASGKHKSIVTRFPPEPNGYLHLGHAKSICLNFGLAVEYGGRCHLRFDDTNPVKEEQEYIDAIKRDGAWLGFDWGKNLFHASDYFELLSGWAEDLIRAGKAYVDDQTPTEMRENRGTLTEPGKDSPFRDRPIEENLDLFRRMRAGEFPNGARVLRAKIDMASGNINLRDPVMYRILYAHLPRTGTEWKIYPSYDYAHGQSDAIEGITHSVCTLEFEDHRPLYEWIIANLKVPSPPHQYEFARLNLTYSVLSKRVLTRLVQDRHVAGWDDPRMPTLAGLRRRGVPAAALREFVKRIGGAKANSVVDAGMFEVAVREVLNKSAQRRMAVLKPLKLVIENYPEGETEQLEAVNHPDDPVAGTRKLSFGRELYIEQDDFMENPPKKFFRLSPGAEVRLRYAYFVTCKEMVKDASGNVVELRCTYDPASRGGNAPDGRKVKATIHWVSAADAIEAEVRVYHPLFAKPDPRGGEVCAAAAAAAVTIALACLARHRPVAFPLIAGIAGIAAGFAVATAQTARIAHPVLRAPVGSATLSGHVARREGRERADRITVRVMTLDARRIDGKPERVRLAIRKDTAPPVGSFVSLKAQLSPPLPPLRPGGYDFARDMYFQEIGASGYALGRITVTPPPKDGGWWLHYAAFLAATRGTIDRRIHAVLDGDRGAIASALITGTRDAISTPVNDAMYISSLAHVLSISGYHMAVVAGIVFFVIRGALALVPGLALRRPIKKWAALAALGAELFYLLLSGSAVATQRTFIMIGIVLIGVMMDRPALAFRTITLAAFGVLLLAPQAVAHPSFQMSFAATLALVAGYQHGLPF